MTRRDWWIGIALVTAALVLHALVPRYTLSPLGTGLVRMDRWTGRVDVPPIQRHSDPFKREDVAPAAPR
jgi:hypothetical protein